MSISIPSNLLRDGVQAQMVSHQSKKRCIDVRKEVCIDEDGEFVESRREQSSKVKSKMDVPEHTIHV
jgi:hypothetical protein